MVIGRSQGIRDDRDMSDEGMKGISHGIIWGLGASMRTASQHSDGAIFSIFNKAS